MIDHPDESPALGQGTTRSDFKATAFVSVASESSQQVAFVNGGPVTMQVRAIKDRSVGSSNSGRTSYDVELIGPRFFPRNCHLEVEIQVTNSMLSGASTGTSSQNFKAMVRRVQMTTTDPSYCVYVRLEESGPSLLREVQIGLGSGRGDASSRDKERAIGLASFPDWARKLVDEGALSELRLERISATAQAEGVELEEALIEADVAVAETIASCKALGLDVPFVEARDYDIRHSNCSLVPEELARRHRVFPLFKLGGTITLGMHDPTDLALIDQVRLRANCQVDQCLCLPSTLDSLIDLAYRPGDVEEGQAPAGSVSDASPRTTSTIVFLVHSMVEEAVRDGASDIHIEPERDKLRVRIRVDGILHESFVHPLDRHASIVSRIKVMAKMDIAQTRRPQDGHFSMKLDHRNVDVRVSTMPTVNGENVVLRLLLSDGKAIDLHELGVPERALTGIQQFIDHPNGMILVTGPTGSGKTTTLYAMLARLSTMERNVVTVEDPVERVLPLVRQTQVNVKGGVTFATGLRSILRQDPDVIMVGEIRDRETAEIAVQAALTGHLVLSTLHTNTAAGAIVRLSEMGIPPFLITSSLRAVIGQRLTRRICAACREPVEPDPKLVAGIGLDDREDITFMGGAGCARCLRTGYKGRVGVYEMLRITPALGAVLLGGASRDAIEKEASRGLAGDLREDALRKVRGGLTTVEEVARIIGVQYADAVDTERGS